MSENRVVSGRARTPISEPRAFYGMPCAVVLHTWIGRSNSVLSTRWPCVGRKRSSRRQSASRSARRSRRASRVTVGCVRRRSRSAFRDSRVRRSATRDGTSPPRASASTKLDARPGGLRRACATCSAARSIAASSSGIGSPEQGTSRRVDLRGLHRHCSRPPAPATGGRGWPRDRTGSAGAGDRPPR